MSPPPPPRRQGKNESMSVTQSRVALLRRALRPPSFPPGESGAPWQRLHTARLLLGSIPSVSRRRFHSHKIAPPPLPEKKQRGRNCNEAHPPPPPPSLYFHPRETFFFSFFFLFFSNVLSIERRAGRMSETRERERASEMMNTDRPCVEGSRRRK